MTTTTSQTPPLDPTSTTIQTPPLDPTTTMFVPSGNNEPEWIDENTGNPVNVFGPSFILQTAISKKLYEYINDGRSIYIYPNTHYYYTGPSDASNINKSFITSFGIDNEKGTKGKVNRIYEEYPKERFIMLTNYKFRGLLNPETTKPAPTQPEYPKVTIISNALEVNNKNLYDQRFNIINTQDTLNTLTNKLNNLKLKISSLNKKPMYSASGKLTFY